MDNPVTEKRPGEKPRRSWLRFSLRTLVLLSLLIGSGGALWLHWEPWYLSASLAGGKSWFTFASFSADSQRLITYCEDGTTQIWDAHSGRLLSSPKSHTAKLRVPSVSANGPILATVGEDNFLAPDEQWKPAMQKVLAKRVSADFVDTPLEDAVAQLAKMSGTPISYPPDASVGKPINCKLQDATLAEALEPILQALGCEVDLRPDGIFLSPFPFEPNRSVRIWDLERGTLIATLRGHTFGIEGIAFSEDGSRAVTYSCGGLDFSWRTWDVQSGRQLALIDRTPLPDDFLHQDIPRGFKTLSFSADGKRFVVSQDLETLVYSMDYAWKLKTGMLLYVDVWDTESGKRVAHLEHEDPVALAVLSPDGSRCATSCHGFSSCDPMFLWDVDSGSQVHAIKEPRQGNRIHFACMGFYPDGKRLLINTPSGPKICDARTGEKLADIPIAPVSAFSPLRTRILYSGRTRAFLTDANFSPAGRTIFFKPSSENTLRLYQFRHPEYWWGLAWLPEFWLTLVLFVALPWSVLRDRRQANAGSHFVPVP